MDVSKTEGGCQQPQFHGDEDGLLELLCHMFPGPDIDILTLDPFDILLAYLEMLLDVDNFSRQGLPLKPDSLPQFYISTSPYISRDLSIWSQVESGQLGERSMILGTGKESSWIVCMIFWLLRPIRRKRR